ncbi:hypothetical protein O181_055883 [Austropuccinia psidii MF-1]|uniref:Defective in cullin neddylation protein n=1 Tax=Austropuccinia psidii MF-1 TaxID=1389203 RepID=A0A9Q3E8L8_9BASI|nr:hypothetical protein [Austropuccinia psidii MF-1]
MSKAQKEKMMAEFRSFTNAIPADASRICKKAGYRLDMAIELFYNDSLAQINAERSMHSRTKALSEGMETILNAQFNEYQDSEDPTRMEMVGLLGYLGSLNLTPEDPKVLCLCHLLHAPRLGLLERSAFVKQWTSLLLSHNQTPSSSIQSTRDMVRFQTKAINDLDSRLKSELSYFQEVYRFIFDFGRDEGQKSLALDTAIAFWEMVLPLTPCLDWSIFKPQYLQWWTELLRSRNKSVSRDTWNLFLDFIIQVEDRFENYDEGGAWPSLIDDYVAASKEKLQAEVMEEC